MFMAVVVLSHDFPYLIFSMLLGHKPASVFQISLRPEQSLDGRCAVRNVQPCGLIVSIILEARGAKQRGIVLGNRIATEGDKARVCEIVARVGVAVAFNTEGPDRIQGVQLGVQTIASIFSSKQRVPVGKGEVIKGGMSGIPKDKNRDEPVIAAFREIHAEDGAPGPASGQSGYAPGESVGITSRVEEKREEISTGTEHSILRTLERRCPGCLCLSVGIEAGAGRRTGARIVNIDPPNRPM